MNVAPLRERLASAREFLSELRTMDHPVTGRELAAVLAPVVDMLEVAVSLAEKFRRWI